MKIEIYLSQEDRPYEGNLRRLLPALHTYAFNYSLPLTISSALISADAIITSSAIFVKLLTKKTKCSLDDYAGSLWKRKDATGREVEILCIPPLKRLVSTKPGIFLCKRYLSKIFKKEDWFEPPPFEWSLCDEPVSLSTAYRVLNDSDVISCDIETSPYFKDRENKLAPQHIIVCVAYTAILFDVVGNLFICSTFVIPLTSLEALGWSRKINDLPQPKIFQNGKYDNFYFLRFNAPVRNWLFDTMEAHHSLFSELPKNLGYIASFYIREVAYWKDEGQTGNLFDLYKYNAKDAWATAIVFLYWLDGAPKWAIQNYLIKFPLVYPCIACELDGLLVHEGNLEAQKIEQKKKQQTSLLSLQKKLGLPTFNPRSPKQVVSLLHTFGHKKETSSDEATLEKVADSHPLLRLLVDEILEHRESSKLISTYLEAILWKGKLLYTLNPSGTDTGRLASKESQLWCGAQIQNLPEYFKRCLEAEEGFFLGEGDFEQSETRCTAYLSGDENLLATVNAPRDFHSENASAIFGLSYEEIQREAKEAKITNTESKTKRYLSKRVTHGTTYNMGDSVLLKTLGVKNVLRSQILLKLDPKLTPKQVCALLLKKFHTRYPGIQGPFYASIVSAIRLTKMLVSQLGWTRLCFGTPWNSKPQLNSYVAHVPSNLSVGIINEAFVEIFWKVQLPSKGEFRLKAQIHDSILFSYKEGRTDLVEEVRKIMTRPKEIIDCKSVKRMMTIPVAMKAEARIWTDLKKI